MCVGDFNLISIGKTYKFSPQQSTRQGMMLCVTIDHIMTKIQLAPLRLQWKLKTEMILPSNWREKKQYIYPWIVHNTEMFHGFGESIFSRNLFFMAKQQTNKQSNIKHMQYPCGVSSLSERLKFFFCSTNNTPIGWERKGNEKTIWL